MDQLALPPVFRRLPTLLHEKNQISLSDAARIFFHPSPSSAGGVRVGRLLRDMNLLLVGGNGNIGAVVLLKWKLKRRTGQVIELSRQEMFGRRLISNEARTGSPNPAQD
ncbi:hypothetical protein N7524_006454 [Penicillium chrysogenum]|nr:hypothetical protein N7524_006454 [Penicillium chrysogenum]